MEKIKLNEKSYTLISSEDLEAVSRYKWVNINNYVNTKMEDGKTILLHHFILGKPDHGFVIDHINGNPLDNRRENLRFATISENNQNSRRQKSGGYTGIYYNEKKNHWRVYCKRNYLGSFKDEIEAAKQYDRAAFILFGPIGNTNKLVKYEEVVGLTLEDITKKPERDLPDNIRFRSQKYEVEIYYDNIKYAKYGISSLEEAIEIKEVFIKQINKLKDEKIREIENKEIKRNDNGLAYINVKEKQVLVDDDVWYKLMKMNWHLSNGYAKTNIGETTMFMHRIIMGINDTNSHSLIVDHINHNRLDNRRSNLRIVDPIINAHNKSKSTKAKSKYYGVYLQDSKAKKKWGAQLTKEGQRYYLSTYENEIDAAKAYNEKAIELYGEYATLNVFDK